MIGILRMSLGRQDGFHQLAGKRFELLGIFDSPRRRATQVVVVRLGHASRQRSRAPCLVGAEMPSHPRFAVENVHDVRHQAHIRF